MAAVLRGEIASRVFDDAITAFPLDLPLRVQCLDALLDVGLAGSHDLEQRIRQGISQDLRDSEAAWDLRAQHAWVGCHPCWQLLPDPDICT